MLKQGILQHEKIIAKHKQDSCFQSKIFCKSSDKAKSNYGGGMESVDYLDFFTDWYSYRLFF